MTNLIPQLRPDKTGKLVTRHVKADTQAKGRSTLPLAPPVTSQAKKAVKALKSQLVSRQVTVDRDTIHTHGNLMKAFFSDNEPRTLTFAANDVEMYAVLDLVPVGEALVLLEHGIRTEDEAVESLTEHGLGYLIGDPDTSAGEAFARGIPAEKYCEIKNRYGNRTEQSRLLDAAEVYAMKPLAAFDFYKDVLRGDTDIEDIKAIGASRIARYYNPNAIRESLWDIRKEDALFTAKDLRAILEKIDKTDCTLNLAEEVMTRFGTEFTLELDDIIEARMFGNSTVSDFPDKESHRNAVRYNDSVCSARKAASLERATLPSMSGHDIKLLMDAGVSPQLAGQQLAKQLNVRQIIAHAVDGIALSVAEGWL